MQKDAKSSTLERVKTNFTHSRRKSMKTLGPTPIGRNVEVRTVTSGKKVAGVGFGQTLASQKVFRAGSAASDLVQAPNAPAQTAASAKSTMTPEQNANMKAAWRQYSDSNPGELVRQMEQYGMSAADMATATGQSHGAIGDMIHRAGRPQGFAGTTYFDPAAGSLTDASTFNTWSYMPVSTYQQYTEKMAAAKNDPLANWLGAGYPTLSEVDWNAQNARVGADKVRGVAFGGGTTPSQQYLAGQQQPPMQVQSVQSGSQPTQVASPSQQAPTGSQQALSDALANGSLLGSKSS